MGESLNQPCRVQDYGPTGLKLLLPGDKVGGSPPVRRYPANKDRLTPCQQPR